MDTQRPDQQQLGVAQPGLQLPAGAPPAGLAGQRAAGAVQVTAEPGQRRRRRRRRLCPLAYGGEVARRRADLGAGDQGVAVVADVPRQLGEAAMPLAPGGGVGRVEVGRHHH